MIQTHDTLKQLSILLVDAYLCLHVSTWLHAEDTGQGELHVLIRKQLASLIHTGRRHYPYPNSTVLWVRKAGGMTMTMHPLDGCSFNQYPKYYLS
jgi:hypothetical protein